MVVSRASRPRRPGASRAGGPRDAGFTLLEVLVSMAILLIIVVGLIPLFTQAIVANTSGAESTQVSNFARSRVEEYFQFPFNAPELTLVGGTELVVDEYYSFADEVWRAQPAPADDPASWTRRTIVRQYDVNALSDGVLDTAEALDAAADPSQVHLKEIEVQLEGIRQGGPLSAGKQITLRALKFK